MARLFPLLFLVNIALVVTALISCLSAEPDELRALPKIAWVFIILLFAPVGPIAYFVAGRPVPATARPGRRRPATGLPAPERPRRQVAPDDDPEFLSGLGKPRPEDDDLMRRWEADLRRREDELRRRETGEERPTEG